MFKMQTGSVLVMALAALSCVACTGCGGIQPPILEQAVTVKGRVAARDGQPISNVALNLQPLETGHAKIVAVRADGAFTIETQPGKYAYYFTPREGEKSIPPQIASVRQASMERTITIADGSDIDIRLP